MYAAIDIETIANEPTESEINNFLAEYLPPANYKDPEKIKAHKEEAFNKWQNSRGFKVGEAKVISVAISIFDPISGEIFDNLASQVVEEPAIADFVVNTFSERDITHLVGFNILNFDLPHLIRVLSQNQKSLPNKLHRNNIIDLFQFPLGREGSFKTWLNRFGIQRATNYDGSNVAEMYANKQYGDIVKYNLDDSICTVSLFNTLSTIYKF